MTPSIYKPMHLGAIWKEVVLLTHNHHQVPSFPVWGKKKRFTSPSNGPHVGHGRLVVQKPVAWQVGKGEDFQPVGWISMMDVNL